jgi:ABC-type Zn uptake system ZnuABC Zn-binding protein ZnuA
MRRGRFIYPSMLLYASLVVMPPAWAASTLPTEVGTALGSLSTDVADPSAGAIAALVHRIRAENVPAIFAETMHNPKVVERLAAEIGAKLPPPLYTDALGPSGSPGETYIKMMRYNVTTIVHALQQP